MIIYISVADSTWWVSSVECRTRKSDVLRSNPAYGNILPWDFFCFFSWFCRIYRIKRMYLHLRKTQLGYKASRFLNGLYISKTGNLPWGHTYTLHGFNFYLPWGQLIFDEEFSGNLLYISVISRFSGEGADTSVSSFWWRLRCLVELRWNP